MIRKLVTFGFEQPWAVFLAWLVIIIAGVRASLELPIEPFPDPDDVHVYVVTQYPGKAAEEVETIITRPLERAINGCPGLTHLRSDSMFGLSYIRTTFDDNTNDYFARQQILERIAQISLPTGVIPTLNPLADSIGEIYRYTLDAPGMNIHELKAVNDWVVIPAILTVPGVADVNFFGGGQKQWVVKVDPALLRAYDVTLPQVFQAIQNGNANGGGAVVERGDQEYTVRSVGLFRNPREIESVVVTQRGGTAVLVRDVAHVERDAAPRRGFVAKDDQDDVVMGIVLVRKGENARDTCEHVKQKVAELNAGVLPKGARVVGHYDRTFLVNHTLRTLLENSLEGLLLVFAVLLLFMGSLRSAIIVVVTIPLSVLFAFVVLQGLGSTINLFSLGAVDFGIVVNPSIIVAEAILMRTLHRRDGETREAGLRATALELGRPIFFATLIIVVLNVPIFAFQRVEGRIFRPMALTVGLAIIGALFLSLTLVPQLAVRVFRGERQVGVLRHISVPLMRVIWKAYGALLSLCLRWRWTVIVSSMLLLGLTAYVAATRLGTEFLPRLEEGNIWLRATMPISVSTAEAKRVEGKIREIVRSFPEVSFVVTQLGKPEDGSDVKPINNLEMHVDLKPPDQWAPRDLEDEKTHRVEHRRCTKDELVEMMRGRLRVIPGVEYEFSQYIQDNVEEALSGVTAQLVVKILGPDMGTLQRLADLVRDSIAKVDKVEDLEREHLMGLPSLQVSIDREKAARAGINVSDIQQAIEAGVGGSVATSFIEPDRTCDVAVRLVRSSRNTPERIRGILLPAPDGSLVPIGEVADVRVQSGASMIRHEANSRRIAVKFGVRGRDLGGFVREAMETVDRDVVKKIGADGKPIWPEGYHISWEGEYEHEQRAMSRLMLIVPMCLLLIFGLLFFTFRSLRTATLILATIPLALIGGVFGLWYMGIYMSVSSAVGFITLCGVAVENGIVMVSKVHTLRDREGLELMPAILAGCTERLRPVLMTGITAALGFLPSVLSHGMGAEVRRPLATVVVFGMITATLFTLIVLPCLYRVFETGPVKAPGLAHD